MEGIYDRGQVVLDGADHNVIFPSRFVRRRLHYTLLVCTVSVSFQESDQITPLRGIESTEHIREYGLLF